MAYIHTIPESEATGQLQTLYRQLANPDGSVDEAYKALSLNPALLAADAMLYRETMYEHSALSRSERELLAVAVSRVNGCERCVRHHAARLAALRHPAVEAPRPDSREQTMVAFAERLTREPATMDEEAISALRDAGLDDRAILDLCNLVSYFNYANRMTLGLGIGSIPG